MESLSKVALSRATGSTSKLVGTDAPLRGSNLGGFQDIFEGEELADVLRQAFASCIRAAACKDAELISSSGDLTPPSSPRCEGSAIWMNVSGRGALNVQHNHGTSVFAAVAYTKLPGMQEPSCNSDHQATSRNEGSLLLRLSRGSGATFMEPDEEIHVPRMWSEAADESSAVYIHSKTDPVLYLQVPPTEGSILLFPGWVPHAVTPHFQNDNRVAFASNWS